MAEWFGNQEEADSGIPELAAGTFIDVTECFKCPHDGDLLKYRTYFGTVTPATTFKFKIWRPTAVDNYTLVWEDISRPALTGPQEYTVTGVTIDQDDVISIYISDITTEFVWVGFEESKYKMVYKGGDVNGSQSGWTSYIPCLAVSCYIEPIVPTPPLVCDAGEIDIGGYCFLTMDMEETETSTEAQPKFVDTGTIITDEIEMEDVIDETIWSKDVSRLNYTIAATDEEKYTLDCYLNSHELIALNDNIRGISSDVWIEELEAEYVKPRDNDYPWRIMLTLHSIHGEIGQMQWKISGWNYRKSLTVTGSPTGDVYNYPIPIMTHYGAGVDDEDDCYLNSLSKYNFSDVRFYDDTSHVMLEFWREEYVVGDYALWWVNIPYLAQNTKTKIIIFYGNEDAQYPVYDTELEHGEYVWTVFDDFSAGEDTDKWYWYKGSTTYSDVNVTLEDRWCFNYLELEAKDPATPIGYQIAGICSKETYNPKTRLRWRECYRHDTDTNGNIKWSSGFATDPIYESWINAILRTYTYLTGADNKSGFNTYMKKAGIINIDNTHNDLGSLTFKKFEIRWSEALIQWLTNDVVVDYTTNDIPLSGTYVFHEIGKDQDSDWRLRYIKWVAIGPWIFPEPAYTTWGD